ncbi:MAG: hypothetical protein KDJ37_05080 [Hyphomicrobiaceae bacterium]|nr:hypothetical protein [Hyphomicrobiaceae bacterium]
MLFSTWKKRLLTVVAIAIAITGAMTPVIAGPPQPAKGRGDKCVADTEWMRRNHMTALHHKRDDTVHEGVRTKTFSLTGCIDCHQVAGTDGRAVTVADPKHFCRTCHDYTAVSVDCFQCHASRPGDPVTTGSADSGHHPPGAAADIAALDRYLKEVGR